MKFKILIFGLSFWILIFGFYISFAADPAKYTLIQPLPGFPKEGVSGFGQYVEGLIPFILGLAAVLAVVMIVVGGIEYAVSEAIDAKADAKDRITQAILGLLLALLSYLILYTINPELTKIKFNIPGIGQTVSQPPGGGGSQGQCIQTACLTSTNTYQYQCTQTGTRYNGSSCADAESKCKAGCK